MTKIMRVLVAGANGQVARALQDRAPPGRVEVVAVARPQLDLTDPASIAAVMQAAAPDLVINAAAYTAVDQAESDEAAAFAVNAVGAGHLAAAAAQAGAAIFHLSTDYVFAGDKSGPYRETDPTGPTGVYGRSKLEGEHRVAAGNPRHAIFRTAWVYSPHGANFVKTMLRLAGTREEIGVVHDQSGNPTSAHDIAAMLWQIGPQMVPAPDAFVPGIYHLTASGEASWAEFAEEIFAVSAAAGGPSARVKRIMTADYPTAARRPANSRLDCTKLADLFGQKLPHWRESTRLCVEGLVKGKGPTS